MAFFPTPTANETADLFEIFQFVNNKATEGLFFPVMILTIWLIGFIGAIVEGRPASRAFIFSSFISTVLGVLLSIMGFLSITYVYFLILMVAFGIFWARLEGARNF
ncbi:hypothetical protein LCGC14_0969480 [marine sediment metagenome]|uniref:Yip1 domain-containing protein n=1 Tax=marine sediment metagenome TaxID=412755 RepID=A0A0F9NC52_9ZZZZ